MPQGRTAWYHQPNLPVQASVHFLLAEGETPAVFLRPRSVEGFRVSVPVIANQKYWRHHRQQGSTAVTGNQPPVARHGREVGGSTAIHFATNARQPPSGHTRNFPTVGAATADRP